MLRRSLPRTLRTLYDAALTAAQGLGEAELWAVGGTVRDAARGVTPRDLDLASGRDPSRLAREIADRTGGVATVEARFGTASVTLFDGPHEGRIDLAALRTERYPRAGSLPEITLGASIEDDLGRRDYSVNAFALCVLGRDRGQVVDPFDGLGDLGRRRLRILHPRSFRDDATRLWRGARLAARIELRPDPATAVAIEQGTRYIEPISGARLWAEFALLAGERRVGRTLALLGSWGVLRGVHPAFEPAAEVARALRHRPGPHAPAVLAAVLLASRERRADVLGRLNAPLEAVDAVDGATALLAASDGEIAPELLERLRATGEAARRAALWIDPAGQPALQTALRRWERTRSHLDARALMRLGVPEGPAIGNMLGRLRGERYLGNLGGAAQARRTVRAWLAAGDGERPA